MKTLFNHLHEALKIGSKTKFKGEHNYHPKTKSELKNLIYDLRNERGDDADLNDIDVSAIADMSNLFRGSNFNGDISEWDVSNVEDMSYMFAYSKFNGDISQWDVKNVKISIGMFSNCPLENHQEKWPKFR